MTAKLPFLLLTFLSVAGAQQIVLRTGTLIDGKGQVLHNNDVVIEAAGLPPSRIVAPTPITIYPTSP